MDKISPSYKMNLVRNIQDVLVTKYTGREITFYIQNWQEIYDNFGNCNFDISYSDQNCEYIDIETTLHGIDGETLLKMAIDLGVETPDYIPSIPIFRNEIKSSYRYASRTFEKAFKDVESDPETACGLAVAALESIIKEIMSDSRILIQCRDKNDLYKLTEDILKAFSIVPSTEVIPELRTLGSALMKSAKALSDIRGDKSALHGHKTGDILISNPTSAYFIVNSISSLGLFLNGVYKQLFPPTIQLDQNDEELPF